MAAAQPNIRLVERGGWLGATVARVKPSKSLFSTGLRPVDQWRGTGMFKHSPDCLKDGVFLTGSVLFGR